MAKGSIGYTDKNTLVIADLIAQSIIERGWNPPLVSYCKIGPSPNREKNFMWFLDRMRVTAWKASLLEDRTWLGFEEKATAAEVLGTIEAMRDAILNGKMKDWLAEYEVVVETNPIPGRKHSERTHTWLYSDRLEDGQMDVEG